MLKPQATHSQLFAKYTELFTDLSKSDPQSLLVLEDKALRKTTIPPAQAVILEVKREMAHLETVKRTNGEPEDLSS